MRIANVLASYSLGEGGYSAARDGEKDPKAMANSANRFMTGAASSGTEAAVEEIFEQMAKFSGYGFNSRTRRRTRWWRTRQHI